jgi:2-oxoglutarate dehydrogenase E2 component (dihydrolipoamide succinyltransferase)
MSIDLKVPEIGESITEVVIGEWLKSEGDDVERDEDVVTVESEKATVEIPAPGSGKLAKILKRSGETANVGEVIGQLEAAGEEAAKTPAARQEPGAVKPAEEENIARFEKAPARDEGQRDGQENVRRNAPAKKQVAARPARAALAAVGDHDRDTTEPQDAFGSETSKLAGEHRREAEAKPKIIESKPLDQPGEAARAVPKPAEEAHAEASIEQRRPDLESLDSPELREQLRSRNERRVPMSPIRRRIAERLVQAQQTSAFLSTFNEIDMSAVAAVRREYQEEFQEKHGVKLGLMSFFVKAAVAALKLVPEVNAEIRARDIVYRDFCDIGIAVGSGKGLVVPVLRNAEAMDFGAIEHAIQEFARKAETNRLKPGDLEGGTFTISNGGIYGSLLSTPIINAPQSAILGMHAIQERPVVRDGQIVVRPMMYVALTYDHRIVDGREAVMFLKRIKDCVEAPSRMLLEI